MIKRTLRGLIQLLGGLGAGLAIIMALLAWKLSQGPISLSFLTPYVEETLSAAHPDFRVELGDTVLAWGGWNRALDIRVVNVRVVDPLETTVASVPELSMSLSARALGSGILAPRRIELFYPTMRLLRLRDGSFQIAFGDADIGARELALRLLRQLRAEPDPANAMSYLARVDVVDADLTIEDQRLETSWRAPSTQVRLLRDEDGVQAELDMDLEVEGHLARVSALGDYRLADRRFEAAVEFEGLEPALFARISPVLAPVAVFELPLDGSAVVSIGEDGAVDSAAFDVRGEDGVLALPGPMAQRLPVRAVAARGRIDGASRVLDIEDLRADFGPEGTLRLPAPAEHAMPLRRLRAAATYAAADGRLDVSRLRLDLQGPVLAVSGSADGLLGGGDEARPELRLAGSLTGIRVEDLRRYWPRAWGTDAYDWCVDHLLDGTAPVTRAEVTVRGDGEGGFDLVSVDGEMELDDISVDYLPPMEPARGIDALARFDRTRFDIELKSGRNAGLALQEGRVLIGGLDEYDQWADIDLKIDGPVSKAMALIDQEPLGFASAVGILPKDTGGHAATRLALDFLLIDELTFDGVDVSAEARLTDLYVADVVLGRSLTEGAIDLQVTKQGLDARGDIKLAGIPTQLHWRRNFGDDAAMISRYELTSHIDDVRRTRDLGFELEPFAEDIVSGSADTELQYTEFRGGEARLKASADLSELAVDLPAIGWSKPAGAGGMAEVSMALKDDVVSAIDHFRVQARDLTVEGSARYSPMGVGLERVDFNRIAYGRTDMKGALIPNQDGSWTASVHGAAFDLAPLYERVFEEISAEGGAANDLDFALSMDLDNVWLGETRRLRDVVGTLARSGDRWRTLRLEGDIGQEAPFHIRILPGKGATRDLDIRAADAGAALKTFGFYDNMIGGKLTLTGSYDDSLAGSPLAGKLTITNYRIRKAPVLAHVVSMAALTGILDSLEGEGLGFLRLEVPFRLESGVIDIKDAKSSGISLGFTAGGKIYTHAEVVDIHGTIVPAYAINAVLGNVPILGDLLTGGEKGGGIFAARYDLTGSLEDPDVSVNPLSALAPGFLRNLFDFKGGKKKDDSPQPERGVDLPEKLPPPDGGDAGRVGGL